MPPRQNKRSFFPPNDSTTYRDILLFEERLKTNAANLQRRKQRYQLLLLQWLVFTIFFLLEVLLPPELTLVGIPYRLFLRIVLPNVYAANPKAMPHPYISSAMLFVCVTTLVLFFATGLYSEKIAYANKYVPHANRALRSFNIFLNVRRPPLRTKFRLDILSFFFPRPKESAPAPRSPSPSNARSRSASAARPIPTIPPATNPRGELIFSSRIDKTFRESYERYRSTFERRREEKAFDERKKTWVGKLMFWERPPTPTSATGQTPPTPSRQASVTSSRGRGSRSGTPPTTPSAGSGGGGGITMKQRDRSGSPMRRLSPPLREKTPRTKRESMGDDMRTAVLEKSINNQAGQR